MTKIYIHPPHPPQLEHPALKLNMPPLLYRRGGGGLKHGSYSQMNEFTPEGANSFLQG